VLYVGFAGGGWQTHCSEHAPFVGKKVGCSHRTPPRGWGGMASRTPPSTGITLRIQFHCCTNVMDVGRQKTLNASDPKALGGLVVVLLHKCFRQVHRLLLPHDLCSHGRCRACRCFLLPHDLCSHGRCMPPPSTARHVFAGSVPRLSVLPSTARPVFARSVHDNPSSRTVRAVGARQCNQCCTISHV
jgi:hypothetical protein